MQIQDENKFNNILKIVQKLGQQGQQGQLLLTDSGKVCGVWMLANKLTTYFLKDRAIPGLDRDEGNNFL